MNTSIVTNMTHSQNETEKTPSVAVAIVSMPAEQVLLKEIPYLQSERKHLAKTLPWTLEEQLVDDVDNLHIAVAILNDELAVAAIVRKDLIKQKLHALQEEKTVAQALVPEQLLLPWQAGQWTAEIQQNGNRWLWRTGAGSGFACNHDDLPLILKLTAEDQGLPQQVIIYSDNIQRDQTHLPNILSKSDAHIENNSAAVESGLTNNIEWRNSSDLPAISAPVINLLQGEFAPQIPWAKIWKQWRTAAYVGIAAIAVQGIYAIADYQLAKNQDVKLRQQIEQTYREAIPTGNMVEPVRQIKRKLASYSNTNSSHFTSLLNDVGIELTKNKALQLQGLTYNEQKNSLQITLLADNFNSVESLRNSFESKGLEAKLSSSNAEGEKVRARLQINGKP